MTARMNFNICNKKGGLSLLCVMRSLRFRSGADRDQGDGLFPQLDLKFIAGLEIQQGSVGLADHQVAVELDFGAVAELSAGTAILCGCAEVHPLGIQEGFVEGCEVEAFGAILFGGDIATGPHEIRFVDVTQLLDLGDQGGASQWHGRDRAVSGFTGGGSGLVESCSHDINGCQPLVYPLTGNMPTTSSSFLAPAYWP